MKRTAATAALTMFCLFAHAASPPSESAWVEATSTDTSTFSIKRGSFEIRKTKGGAPIAVVLGQVTNKTSSNIEYRKWYVSKDDCSSGMGKLVMLDTKGDYVNEVDFVAKGESAASGIADLICAIYKQVLDEQAAKSI